MTDVIVKDNYLPEADFLTIYNKLCNIDQKDPQRLPWFPGNPLKPLQPKVNILCQTKFGKLYLMKEKIL